MARPPPDRARLGNAPKLIHFRIRYEQLRTRLEAGRRGTALVRALSLALVPLLLAAPAWAAGYLGPWPWLWPAASVAVFAVAWARFARPRSLTELGELLDHRFQLDDLLVTAIEVDRRGPESPLEVHLLDDAASALARIERDPALEPGDKGGAFETLAGTACIVAGAWLLAAAFGSGPDTGRLPALAQTGLVSGIGGLGTEFEMASEDDAGADSGGAQGGDDALLGARTAVPPPPQAGGTGGEAMTPIPPGTPPSLAAGATLQAQGAPGGGAAADRDSGEVSAGEAADDAVLGGGGTSSGTAAGGGLPPDHREAVRRYFSQR